MVITLKINGTLRGPKDGVLINISPDSINDKITFYDPSDAKDLGFINKLHGLVIAVRSNPKSPSNSSHSKLC